MKLTESIRISWRAITSHKLRSTLTTLGIILGIGAVIVFMVLGGGFEADIIGDIETEEDTSIQVRTATDSGFGQSFSQSKIYTQSDLESLQEIDGLNWVTASGDLQVIQLTYDGETVTGGGGAGSFSVSATGPERFDSDIIEMTEGEVYEKGSTDQAVVNEKLVEMYGGDVAIGDEITMAYEDGNEQTVTVTGVVDDDTGSGIPPRVYTSLANYQTTVETPDGAEERAYSYLLADAENFDEINEVRDNMQSYMDTDSDAAKLKPESYTIQVQTVEDAVDQFQSIVDQIAILLGGIASISLIVGSIGIANIMIVSVTERTREIGIMKAVGARKRDILQLFLIESVILGAIGAVVGVAAGLGVGYIGVTLLDWPMAYPVTWIAIAVLVGVLVGVLSGVYPAWRGAKVNPIEALRHE